MLASSCIQMHIAFSGVANKLFFPANSGRVPLSHQQEHTDECSDNFHRTKTEYLFHCELSLYIHSVQTVALSFSANIDNISV